MRYCLQILASESVREQGEAGLFQESARAAEKCD